MLDENLLHPIPAVHENPKFPFAFSATILLFAVMNALVYFNIVVADIIGISKECVFLTSRRDKNKKLTNISKQIGNTKIKTPPSLTENSVTSNFWSSFSNQYRIIEQFLCQGSDRLAAETEPCRKNASGFVVGCSLDLLSSDSRVSAAVCDLRS